MGKLAAGALLAGALLTGALPTGARVSAVEKKVDTHRRWATPAGGLVPSAAGEVIPPGGGSACGKRAFARSFQVMAAATVSMRRSTPASMSAKAPP